MNRKNKRGFLLAEETLKMVIAVIAIGFLIYFLTSIYLKSKESKDLELAKASLEHLIDEINLGHNEVEIYNPSGWVIVSWPHKVLKGTVGFREEVNDMPNSCSNLNWENCLCVCGDTLILNLEGSDCDKKGVCMQSNAKVYEDKIEISKPLPQKLNIQYSNEEVIIR